jgi:hypothetical protein
MYQVFCMKDTPPVTSEEQERCLRSKTCCWRLVGKQKNREQQSSASPEAPLHTS